jgi:hypothetical protein
MLNKIKSTLWGVSTIGLLLTSCGEKTIQEKTIKASNISVSGEGSSYVKVVDGDYTLKVVDDKIVIPVKFELIKKYEGKDGEFGSLSLIPLDKSGVAVPDIGLDLSPATMSDWDKIKDLLKSEVGKTVIISFEWNYFSKKDVQARIMKETENFEITRADFTGGNSEEVSENSSTEDTESTVSSGNEDWDKALEDYENYVDEYIKFLKKANKGDMTAMTQYPALMQKAQEMEKSLGSAQADNDLSPEQIEKMMNIQTKMMKAAAEMQAGQ